MSGFARVKSMDFNETDEAVREAITKLFPDKSYIVIVYSQEAGQPHQLFGFSDTQDQLALYKELRVSKDALEEVLKGFV